MQRDTLAVVMAGGMGERLKPLTDVRAKPSVPFGAIYRIIDFTLSNCINSNVRQVYVLTQYKSYSLSNHLRRGWNFLSRRLGQFIDEIPAQMQVGNRWYKGTADAIRQNLGFIQQGTPRLVLILSGDHVYKMDYRLMRTVHDARKACLTVSAIRVPAAAARGQYGVLEVDARGRVVGFAEKPEQPKTIDGTDECYASMGIYLFDYRALTRRLDNDFADFGKEVIPAMVTDGEPVYAFDFTADNRIEEYIYTARDGDRVRELTPRSKDSGYWRDVGTLASYWRANLDLVAVDPMFNLYGENWPFFNTPYHLPPAKFVHETADRVGTAINSIIADRVIVSGAKIRSSVLGPGIYVHSYALIENSVLMGGGMENGVMTETTIGRGARIRNAIIDKQVRIPEGVLLGYDRDVDESRGLVTEDVPGSDDYIVVIPKQLDLA